MDKMTQLMIWVIVFVACVLFADFLSIKELIALCFAIGYLAYKQSQQND